MVTCSNLGTDPFWGMPISGSWLTNHTCWHREYFLDDADIAWTAAEDLSTWAISLGGQSRCRDAAAAAEPAAPMQPDQASVVSQLLLC